MADLLLLLLSIILFFFFVEMLFLYFTTTHDHRAIFGDGSEEGCGTALGRGRRALSTALRVRKSIAGAAAFREIQDGVPCEGNVWSGY